MTADSQILWLFGGVGGLLVVATLIARLLRLRQTAGDAPRQSSPGVENLNARVDAWWAMVALLGLAFLFGGSGVIVLFALISLAALREFLTLTHTRRGDHWALLAAFFLALPAQYGLIAIGWYGLYAIFIPVYAFLLVPVIAVLRGDTQRFLERISETQWGLMLCVYCLSYVPALTTLEIAGFEGRQLLLVAFLVLVVQMSDVLQYVWGKLIGRHRIAPAVSPGKTVEGMAGGIASATLLGAALWWITPFQPWEAAALAFAATAMGFVGGLVMSAIKRDRGVKDWGWMIEGHGGVLDRLDSLVFAAPIFFHLVRYFWSG
ncbi:phosphatidate cytidylyltransferase [Pelagibius sp.]|uniref:phosphatidate cytidylyltransferase n=1 Tax=Pelagibius sp. TaxID=1931238 RepID=UPI002627E70A|nr:phosphatidate cytidylyltransferase [Pelagibius sp.]